MQFADAMHAYVSDMKAAPDRPRKRPAPFESLIRPLPRAFFARDPRRVARELLGKVLLRTNGNQRLSARIVEVEAYLGKKDPASHTYIGQTMRNAVPFGRPDTPTSTSSTAITIASTSLASPKAAPAAYCSALWSQSRASKKWPVPEASKSEG